jgi:glutamine---fructose-6-phosphate transaminase (isomerizing)
VSGAGGNPPSRRAVSPAILPAAARERFLRLAPDGPDEMGREMARGPEAVASTLALLDPGSAAGESALAAVATASRIVLVGTGASLAMARTAAPCWRSEERLRVPRSAESRAVGRPIVVRESTEAVFAGPDGDAFRRGDVVVAVSQSGTSPETVAATRLAAASGADLIAVTANDSSPLSELSRHTVLVPIDEERGAATESELGTLAALLRLGGVLPSDAGTRAVLAAWLTEIIRSWPSVEPDVAALAIAGRTWIVGLGPTSGLAHAGGLLWHEKVHREVAGGSVSEFRHGQVEAVGPGDAVLVLVPPAPSPDLEAYLGLLGRELAELHASELRLDAEVLPAMPATLPGAAGLLGMLLGLQQRARGTAHAAGTYVDGFRVLRRVVRAAPPRFE